MQLERGARPLRAQSRPRGSHMRSKEIPRSVCSHAFWFGLVRGAPNCARGRARSPKKAVASFGRAFRPRRARSDAPYRRTTRTALVGYGPDQFLSYKWQKMFRSMASVLLGSNGMKNNRTKSNLRQNRVHPIVVHSLGSRCMAFRDQAGQLRNFWNGKVLPLPVHILDPEN
jgi:hypothetical protein